MPASPLPKVLCSIRFRSPGFFVGHRTQHSLLPEPIGIFIQEQGQFGQWRECTTKHGVMPLDGHHTVLHLLDDDTELLVIKVGSSNWRIH